MNLNYNTDIPLATNNPSVDQPGMQINTNSINSWVAIDHHGFEDNLGGYHTIIHQDTGARTVVGPTITGAPASIPGPPQINQLFSMLVTPDTTGSSSDTQLFALTANSVANNGLSQLTGSFNSDEGYQWLGGVLLQWGRVNVAFPVTPNAPTIGTVTFKDRSAAPSTIPFPNSLFSVLMTPIHNTAVGATNGGVVSASVRADPLTFLPTSFDYVVEASVTLKYVGFYWLAIGR